MSRYDTDRALGYKDEAVAQRDKRWVSVMAEAAEDWVARFLGLPGGQGDLGHADPGWDLIYRGWRIDVKWSQTVIGGQRGKARDPGYPVLSVPEWKPRKADIYVLTFGDSVEEIDKYAWAFGWATRQTVEAAPVLDLGYRRESTGKGAPFYGIGFDYLSPLADLTALPERMNA